MKIFCICIVKNEEDIIEQTLRAAAFWADSIFVYDNGSTDDTWEKVKQLNKTKKNVMPYKTYAKPFSNSMRREPFVDFRYMCENCDWWCILDSDEIYAENPRDFLRRVPCYYQVVWSISVQFKITDEDMRQFEQKPSCYADDVPVTDKLRYYKTDWSEARFFRYDHRLIWPKRRAFPLAGAVYPKRILMKHYKHRSPIQIQRRLAVRKAANKSGVLSFRRERDDGNWRSYVTSAEEMDFDCHDGQFVVRDELMPRLPLTARLPPRLVNFCRSWKRLIP